MCVPPRRALIQTDWPKTTRKLIPSPQNLRLRVTWRSRSSPPGFPYSAVLCPGTPAPSSFVSLCVSSDNSLLSVGQQPTLWPWKGSPFLQQLGKRAFIHLRFSKQLLPSWSGWHTHCFLRAAPLLRPWENLPSWTQPGGKEIFLAQLSGSRLGA